MGRSIRDTINEMQRELDQELLGESDFDYSNRSKWLRAAVLGANDGLVSTASLMMGVGAVKQDVKVMILTGFAGLVAGACSMAIGEFVSVYSQLDIEVAQRERDRSRRNRFLGQDKNGLPNPLQAAAASVFAFAMGAMVPLLAAAFVTGYKARIGVVIAAVSVALAGFGWAVATLGNAPPVWSSARVLFGGWVAMALTFGLTKMIGSGGQL